VCQRLYQIFQLATGKSEVEKQSLNWRNQRKKTFFPQKKFLKFFLRPKKLFFSLRGEEQTIAVRVFSSEQNSANQSFIFRHFDFINFSNSNPGKPTNQGCQMVYVVSYQISHFGYILEGLWMQNFGVPTLWPRGIFAVIWWIL
jgi:hypothetical protein